MRKQGMRVILLASILMVALCATASAQGGLSIVAYSVDAGGGSSAGGGFTLDAVIAQPISGDSSGGGMTVSGGIVDTVTDPLATATPTAQPGSTPTPYRNFLPNVGR